MLLCGPIHCAPLDSSKFVTQKNTQTYIVVIDNTQTWCCGSTTEKIMGLMNWVYGASRCCFWFMKIICQQIVKQLGNVYISYFCFVKLLRNKNFNDYDIRQFWETRSRKQDALWAPTLLMSKNKRGKNQHNVIWPWTQVARHHSSWRHIPREVNDL